MALAALCAGGREQQQRPAFPRATNLPLICTELLNCLAIPVIPVRHRFPPLPWLLTWPGQRPDFVHSASRVEILLSSTRWCNAHSALAKKVNACGYSSGFRLTYVLRR